MDNELVILCGDKELRFKLRSAAIVLLEKVYGRNIFEIFQDLSFASIQRIFWEALIDKSGYTMDTMMDELMEYKSLIELGNEELQQLAVKSGILKASDLENNKEESLEEIKNA